MTTRRGFLGLLAAAPVAAPTLVKAAVETVQDEIAAAQFPMLYGRGLGGYELDFGSITTGTIRASGPITMELEPLKIAAKDLRMNVRKSIDNFGAVPLEPGYSMQDGKLVHDGITRLTMDASPPLEPIETFTVSAEGMAKFQHALDNPKPPTQKLKDLMRRDPLWATPTIAPTHWVQILHDKPSRRAFDLMNPDPACVDFDKMALTLSRLPRFGGQTKEGEAIYSVLQHQVEGCYAILRDTGNRKAAAAFLIHDGHEYVIGDQVTPVQRALQAHAILLTGDLHAGEIVRDALASLRSTLDCAIYAAAGLDWPLDPETRRIVKEYDLRMCRTERDARMQPAPFSWHSSIEDAEPVAGCQLGSIEPHLYVRSFKQLSRQLLPAFGGKC